MWRALKRLDIHGEIIEIIKEAYNDFTCRVVHQGKITEPFAVSSGVKQKCILLLTIFLAVLNEVMRNTTEGKKRDIQWGLTKRLKDLDFADNIYLLAQNYTDLEGKLRDLETEARTTEMQINIATNKRMKINTRDQRELHIIIGKIEEVGEFTYLCSKDKDDLFNHLVDYLDNFIKIPANTGNVLYKCVENQRTILRNEL
ncbi:PREDICTED: uncharacterized protein LOC106745394 [Dinoponera quadriceps]|uniref:Uncharacterized protein LOC106745394 n=1 Tax=Dinoponera quadriceps TaxID=609295 RepID=A0A6P3XDE5_DINQU|nr:PREDICTED: uncharacterized protein LOC106745394 [Dinoponera quadriceps]